MRVREVKEYRAMIPHVYNRHTFLRLIIIRGNVIWLNPLHYCTFPLQPLGAGGFTNSTPGVTVTTFEGPLSFPFTSTAVTSYSYVVPTVRSAFGSRYVALVTRLVFSFCAVPPPTLRYTLYPASAGSPCATVGGVQLSKKPCCVAVWPSILIETNRSTGNTANSFLIT